MGERRTRVAAWTALAIQPVFLAYWLIAGLVEPHYSPTREFVSEMGASTAARPWLLDLMLSLWGVSLLAVAIAVHGATRSRRFAAAVALLAVAGVASVLAGPIHLSCAASVHPHCPGSGSFLHRAHNGLATINQFGIALSSPAVVWALWPRTAAKVLLGPALLGVALLLYGLIAGDPHDPHAGLGQRTGFVVAQGWIMVLAVSALIVDERMRVRGRSAG